MDELQVERQSYFKEAAAGGLFSHVIVSPCLSDRGDQLICTAGVMIDSAER